MIAEYFQYNVLGLSTLASAIVSLAVGLLVLSTDWRSRLHQSFFLITLTGGMWLTFISMVELVRHSDDALFWIRTNYTVAVPFISPCVYLFSRHWRGIREGALSVRLGFILAAAIGLFPALFGREIFFFAEVPGGRFDQFHKTPLGITNYVLVMGIFVTYATMAFRNFVYAFKEASSPARRLQCKLFLVAAGVGYTGSVDFPVAFGWRIYPWGYLSFLGFVLIIAYAIIRYRFLNVDVYIKRLSLVFMIYSILIAAVLPFAVPVFNYFLTQSSNPPLIAMVATSVGVGLALSLGPLIYAFLIRHSLWLRNQVTAGLTHELKSPLYTILSAVEAMRSKSADQVSDRDYLRMIQSNAERLEHFVRDLLHVAQLQEGRVTIRRERFELNNTVRSEIAAHLPAAAAKGAQIDLIAPDSVYVRGDEEKIRQVVSNLLSNAIKFSPDGKRISVHLSHSEFEVTCSVADEGPGIAPELQEKVFEKFFTGPNSSKGAGLGLAIAKGWVEAHGGRIWARCGMQGRGTVIFFTLQVA